MISQKTPCGGPLFAIANAIAQPSFVTEARMEAATKKAFSMFDVSTMLFEHTGFMALDTVYFSSTGGPLPESFFNEVDVQHVGPADVLPLVLTVTFGKARHLVSGHLRADGSFELFDSLMPAPIMYGSFREFSESNHYTAIIGVAQLIDNNNMYPIKMSPDVTFSAN